MGLGLQMQTMWARKARITAESDNCVEPTADSVSVLILSHRPAVGHAGVSSTTYGRRKNTVSRVGGLTAHCEGSCREASHALAR